MHGPHPKALDAGAGMGAPMHVIREPARHLLSVWADGQHLCERHDSNVVVARYRVPVRAAPVWQRPI